MANKTILVTKKYNDSLTSFDNEQDHYNSNNLTKQKSTFKRSRVKNKNSYDISMNPFISCSSSIMKFVLELNKEQDQNDIYEIKEVLIEKIDKYEEELDKLRIDEKEQLTTKYILCTFIDEIINTTSLRNNNTWTNNSMLSTYFNETYGGDNFFNMLDKFLKAPAKYIHILELMYICITLGFKGKYRVINRGDLELNLLKDSLFQQIKIVQGKEPVNFYIKQEPIKDKFSLFKKVSYPLLFTVIFIMLFIVYFSLSYSLNSSNSEFEYILNEDTTYQNLKLYERKQK